MVLHRPVELARVTGQAPAALTHFSNKSVNHAWPGPRLTSNGVKEHTCQHNVIAYCMLMGMGRYRGTKHPSFVQLSLEAYARHANTRSAARACSDERGPLPQ